MICDRIKEILDDSKLKKVEFAKKLNIDQSYVTRLVSGEKSPSNRLIEDICEKFLVNEEWLRNGTGEMHLPEEDETAIYVSELLEDDENPLYNVIKMIMKTYISLGEKEKEVLKSFAKNLIHNLEDRD